MSPRPTAAPFGSWTSPITSQMITRGAAGLGQTAHGGGMDYWVEFRPWEAGRAVLVRRMPDGVIEDLVPASFNLRSRVHEYGGDSFCLGDDAAWMIEFTEQRVWRIGRDGKPEPLGAMDNASLGEPVWDQALQRLILVAEIRADRGEPENCLVAMDREGRFQTLAQGADFYAFPRPSPDGGRMAWLEWSHPDMPWDQARLCVADVAADGELGEKQVIAGGNGVAAFQPEWDQAGRLIWVDDRDGWWRLYREDRPDSPLCDLTAEFGLPLWQLGMHSYRPLPDGRIFVTYCQDGIWRIGLIDPDRRDIKALDLGICGLGAFSPAGPDRMLAIAQWTDRPAAIVAIDLKKGTMETLRPSMTVAVPPEAVSIPQTVSFPGAKGEIAHGFYYPPTNAAFCGMAGEKPPLIVKSHGGPTSQTSCALSLKIQYWTSRGFAVLDVNYAGSTGYGRAYRDRLKGQWGLADVADVSAGALHLAERGLADPERLIITGGSAGGYTTLSALTFTNVFKAGCSSYGIGDLETLARDTHKFESRYLDALVGPWPQAADVYRARSPIHHVDRLNCPVIFLQGADDKVVPPNQAEAMVAALDDKGVAVAYILFEGEGHGFRKADSVRRALESELGFYGRIFGFAPADEIEYPTIRNLAAKQ